MLKEILETLIEEKRILEEANPVKQIILTTDLAYQDFLDELYKETRISKKELVKMIMNGEDTELDIDANDILSDVAEKYAKKLAKGFEKLGYDETDVNMFFEQAEDKIKDPIKYEVMKVIEDYVINKYL